MHNFKLPLPSELDPIKGKGRNLLLVVWNSPNIKTHEIVESFLPSNNLHTTSDRLKPKLLAAGWQFKKYPVNGCHKSHAWRLEQIEKPDKG
ncbi:hypothetical protein C9I43_14315 [Shewanella morhuae]|uniref:Uncharacterized protein n=1 Tax=Shewanella morhuae TaxID=365591 RepID=A0ABX5HXD5_9GAMM|nr:hypothetical protein [Shewanella morhuae]PTA51581.1 hypothetical protein C9I43_14315 [Shewanella morhuae]